MHPDWALTDLRVAPRYGYRAVHFVTRPPKPVELQIRSTVQQIWAETSERFELRYEGVKYGRGPEYAPGLLQRLSDLLREFESTSLTRALLADRAALADALERIVVKLLRFFS